MKIAVNTRLLLPNKLEGIGWYTYETLARITRNHPEHEFLFMFDRPFSPEFVFTDNITPIVVSPPARHPILFFLWFEWMLPPKLRKFKADIFLSPDGYLSQQSEIKQLPVIHDINFEHYPQHLPLGARLYLKEFFPRFAKKATRIATVSEFSKQDIVKQYGIAPDLIDVTYNGKNTLFKQINDTEKASAKMRFTKNSEYFIYIGSIHPRKNMHLMFKAFDLFKKKHSSDVKLLIVGEKKWWTTSIQQAYDSMTFQQDVCFTGRLSSEDLAFALGGAKALLYVSYFEGFGIPIIEAMASGVPVITSNVTSMPEIANDAAILVSPFDPNSILEGMEQVAFNTNETQALIMKGFLRAQDFSWNKTAALLWQSIEKTVEMDT